MKVTRLSSFLFAALGSLAVACGGGGDDGGGGGTVDPEGTHSQYVLDSTTIPQSATEASMLALNIDGDEQGRPDNALGMALAAVISQGDLMLQQEVQAAVEDGSIIILMNVQATSLDTATGVGTWVFLGENADPAPCTDPQDPMTCGNHLEGGATFDIAPDSPEDALLVGQIAGGQFSGGPGNVTLELALEPGADPLPLNLIGAQAEYSISDSGVMSGVLGGAIEESDLEADILPAVHDLIVDILNEDCTGTAPMCCTDGSTGQTVYDLFDTDDDCAVSFDEFKNNSLISSLLAPDVDLLDENGDFNPLSDGVKESVSIGVGFSAVGADFELPASVMGEAGM